MQVIFGEYNCKLCAWISPTPPPSYVHHPPMQNFQIHLFPWQWVGWSILSRWGIECLSPLDSVGTERKRNIPGNCADESWPALAPTDDSGVSKYIYRVWQCVTSLLSQHWSTDSRSDGRSEGGSLSSSAPHSVGDSTESTEVIGGIVDEPDRRFPYFAPVCRRKFRDAQAHEVLHAHEFVHRLCFIRKFCVAVWKIGSSVAYKCF